MTAREGGGRRGGRGLHFSTQRRGEGAEKSKTPFRGIASLGGTRHAARGGMRWVRSGEPRPTTGGMLLGSAYPGAETQGGGGSTHAFAQKPRRSISRRLTPMNADEGGRLIGVHRRLSAANTNTATGSRDLNSALGTRAECVPQRLACRACYCGFALRRKRSAWANGHAPWWNATGNPAAVSGQPLRAGDGRYFVGPEARDGEDFLASLRLGVGMLNAWGGRCLTQRRRDAKRARGRWDGVRE